MQISDEQYEEMEGRLNTLTAALGFILQSGITISIPRAYWEKFLLEVTDLSVVTLLDKDFLYLWLGKEA